MASTWMLRPALVLLTLLGLSGCADDPPSIPCEIFPEPIPLTSMPGLLRVGRPFRLSIVPTANPGCNGTTPRPDSVTAELEGPGGEPVTHKIELSPERATAVLEFTPERPGPHHLLIAFSQVGGIHQFDFHAALDRSEEAPSQPFSRSCSSLERTLQGAWVCDTIVLRGETSLGVFTGSRLAVAEDVIWVVGTTAIYRYVDTGTDLVMTGSLSRQSGVAEFLLASPEELAVLHNGSLVLYTFKAGVLAAGGAEPWSRPEATVASHGSYGVLLREGERLALGTRAKVGNGSAVQVCPYQLLAGRFQRTQEDCRLLPGEIVGFEPGVLWTVDPPAFSSAGLNRGLLHRWQWTQGQLVEQGALALGIHAFIHEPRLLRPAATPVVGNASPALFDASITTVATWSPQRKTVILESLDADMQQVSASPSLYWGPEPTSSTGMPTKVRTRPPSP